MLGSPCRGSAISRRQFVLGAGLVGCGLLGGCRRPSALGQAEMPPAPVRVGWLHSGLLDSYTRTQADAFREGMTNLGYVEGQHFIMEYRWAEGQPGRLPGLAGELVNLPVDLIVAQSTVATQAAKSATTTVPIVMTTSVNPVANRLVASLARPGGNVTGLSAFQEGLPGKRLQLFREALPGVKRIGVLWDANVDGLAETQAAARALGVEIISLGVRSPDDFDEVFERAIRAEIDGLFQLEQPVIIPYRARVVQFAVDSSLPGMFTSRAFVQDGGLMAYGTNVLAQYRRAAYYVDRILKGTKPADLPVEQPREFDFVINLKTAQALGLTIPQHVLLQTTETIQ